MGDTLMTVIVIGITVVLMFVIPLMTMADKVDNVAQLTIQAETAEFVDTIRTTGKITPEEYNKYMQTITASTGNTYDVHFEAKILDDNESKKAVQVNRDKIGENYYYGVFDSQIKEKIDNNIMYQLKEGDIIKVWAVITSPTLAQQLKNSLYSVVGNDTYLVVAQATGTVTK